MFKKAHKIFVSIMMIVVLLMGVQVFSEEMVASIDTPLSTYFARVQVNPLYQMINIAAVEFGKVNLKETEFEGLPVLSRNSTTHGGFRGASDFLDLPAGELTQANINSMYRYNNTVQALKLNGKQVMEWIEHSGGNFNQIDPNETEDQMLINYTFDGHHLDHFWGITYMYDVTQPLGKRLVYAEYEGKPLSEEMHFIVMSDNFRAGGGGGLPHAVPENIVMKWDVNFREVLVNYLKQIEGVVPKLVINWSIKPIETKGSVVVQTGPEWGIPVMEYMEVAAELDIEPVEQFEYIGTEDVWGLFEIDLAKVKTP